MRDFPYGKPACLILALAVISGVVHCAMSVHRRAQRPDLVFAIFAKNHEAAYRDVLGDFERRHGVAVQMQLVQDRALQSRLQSALLTGAPAPDVVELLEGSMGYFSRGPLADVGFVGEQAGDGWRPVPTRAAARQPATK